MGIINLKHNRGVQLQPPKFDVLKEFDKKKKSLSLSIVILNTKLRKSKGKRRKQKLHWNVKQKCGCHYDNRLFFFFFVIFFEMAKSRHAIKRIYEETNEGLTNMG